MTALINADTSSGVVITSDTSGSLALQSAGTTKATVSSTGVAITNLTASGTTSVANLTATGTFGGGVITSGTSVATTSGTSVTVSNTIPSWAKRITVMFNAVSTTGTSNILIQLGTAGGLVSSGYVSGTSAGATPTSTAGFLATGSITAAQTTSGVITLSLFGSNTWVESGNTARDGTANPVCACAGYGAIGGTVTQIAITTVGGTDTFDAGSVNILYEG